MLTNGNYFFTAIFALESFLKLAAMSPRYFFAVRTNLFPSFDFGYLFGILLSFYLTRNFFYVCIFWGEEENILAGK
jgi:hypothetical protein